MINPMTVSNLETPRLTPWPDMTKIMADSMTVHLDLPLDRICDDLPCDVMAVSHSCDVWESKQGKKLRLQLFLVSGGQSTAEKWDREEWQRREREYSSTPLRRLGFELTDAVPLMRITIISIELFSKQFSWFLNSIVAKHPPGSVSRTWILLKFSVKYL